MVDALGVCGYEGTFRRACEITLEFLRNHEDMVMTMLEMFLHDPINDWKKKKAVSATNAYSPYFQVPLRQMSFYVFVMLTFFLTSQPTRKLVRGYRAANSPEEALSSIRNKIRGIQAEEAMPLTVPGQVGFLISQAIDPANLCQMYVGWLPFW